MCLYRIRWEVGSCFGENLLSRTTGLGSYQKCLRKLSLHTDPECRAEALDVLDLTQFDSLQSFAWRGIRGDGFDALSQFVKADRRALTTLQLDFVNWVRAEKAWNDHRRATHTRLPPGPGNFFARDILHIHSRNENPIFPSLTTLELGAVSFVSAAPEMIHAFNMHNLTRLNLWNCPFSLFLLNKIVDTAQTPRLKSFELAVDIDCVHSHLGLEGQMELPIARFLCAFDGLEDLSIMLPQPLAWDIIIRAVWHHRITLTRLTLHDRDIDSDEDSIIDGDIPWSEQRQTLHRDTRLSYIGTSGTLPQLVRPFSLLRDIVL